MQPVSAMISNGQTFSKQSSEQSFDEEEPADNAYEEVPQQNNADISMESDEKDDWI